VTLEEHPPMRTLDLESLDQIKASQAADIERLRAPDGYLFAGLPWFKTLFGRDSLLSAWQLLDYDPSIAKDTLRCLAQHQGRRSVGRTDEAPGKILHILDYTPPYFPLNLLAIVSKNIFRVFPYFGSVDSTPLFILVAARYLEKTGDSQFISDIWPNIEMAADWTVSYGDLDGDGFIEYARGSRFGVRNQNWKDALPYVPMKLPVAAVEVQGYAYAALVEAAGMARKLGRDSRDWERTADNLRTQFNRAFWMDDLGYFALALDGNKEPVREIASNQGRLFFTGIMDEDKERKVVARLFAEDMFTPYGIRTHSTLSRYFDPRACHLGTIWPHDNWMIWLGLRSRGYAEESETVLEATFRAYRELSFLPEFFNVIDGRPAVTRSHRGVLGLYLPFRKPCYPQAWVCGSLWYMANTLATESGETK